MKTTSEIQNENLEKKYVTFKESVGLSGMVLDLNYAQCMALSEFFTYVQSDKVREMIRYPDLLIPFFDLFKSFNNMYNEDLFK